MKESRTNKGSLINARVNPGVDVSKSVKAYVNFISGQAEPILNENTPDNKEPKHKVSLTDWRKLYHHRQKSQEKKDHLLEKRTFTSARPMTQRVGRLPLTRKSDRTTGQLNDTQRSELIKKKESNLDSALVQNYYATELVFQKPQHIERIKRHYLKMHEVRPPSTNWSKRKMLSRMDRSDDVSRVKEGNTFIKENINKLMKSVCTEKYDKTKLKEKYIRRMNLSLRETNSQSSGFRYAGGPQ